MDRIDKYTVVDELPLIERWHRSSVWDDIISAAKANPGKWVRRDREYSRAETASVTAANLRAKYGVKAVSRQKFVYVRILKGDNSHDA